MRRLLLLFLILSPILGLGQTYTYPAEQTQNIFTNTNLFTLGLSTGPVAFSSLQSPPPLGNGTIVFCSDCTFPSNPCISGGFGAVALYINNAWNCNTGTGGSGSGPTLETNGVSNSSQILFNLADSTATGAGITYVHPDNTSGGLVNLNLVLQGSTGSMFYQNSSGYLVPASGLTWNGTSLTSTLTNAGVSYAISGNQITNSLSAGVYGGEFGLNFSGTLGPAVPGDAGLRGDADVQPASTGSGGTFSGLFGTASNESGGAVTGLYGVYGYAGLVPPTPLAGSSVGVQAGGYFQSQLRSLAITLNAGVYAQLTNTICTTCVGTTNAALYADSPAGLVGTFTHNYGLYVADQTVFESGGHNLDPHGIYVAGGGIQNAAVSFATLNGVQPCAAAFEGEVNAVSDAASASPGTIITGSGSNHVLAYCNGTNWVVGGTGSSGSGGGNPILENCTPDQTGNSFYNVSSLTNYFDAAWNFVFNTTTSINCQVYIPTAQTGATIVLDIAANDSTAGHTALFQTCDEVINSGTINVGPLTCASNQTFTTTSTAYNRVTLTFNVQSTLSNGSILLVKIGTSPSGTAPTANLLVYPHFVL